MQQVSKCALKEVRTPMQTISVLNRKGGVGKSTIATNLARAFQRRGDEVVLIDTDPQGSASDWCEAAIENGHECPPTFTVDRPIVHEQLPQLNGYDVAVIDGVAKVSEMDVSSIKASDLVLIPVRPSAVDVWAVGEIVDLVDTRREVAGGPEAALVSSQAIVGTNLADAASDALTAFELPVWEGTCQRVAYARAMGEGQGVLDQSGADKAQAEVEQLTDRIIDSLTSATSQ